MRRALPRSPSTETLRILSAEPIATLTADTLALDLPVPPEAELPHVLERDIAVASPPPLRPDAATVRGNGDATVASAASDAIQDLLVYKQRVREAVHEAGNPLTIIKNYLLLLELRQREPQAAAEIRLIRSEIDRTAAILADMLAPAAAPAPAHPIDLNHLVTTMHDLYAGAFASAVHFNLDLTAQPALATADPAMLKQILTNLVKNAVEAMEGDGGVTLSTRVNIRRLDCLYVQLTVADTGPGITQEVMAQLFNERISTRNGAQRGSGLMIVKRLVEAMQGQVVVESGSKGAAVTLSFPQAQQPNRDKA